MIYLNESCFKNKILIEMSLEALWEMLFVNPSKGKEMVFNEMISQKIKARQDIFYEHLKEEVSNPESYFYQTLVAENFLMACRKDNLYDFLTFAGGRLFPIFFIDSHRVHNELNRIKTETDDLKDSLTQEEYENLITEELIYSLENFAIIKREEVLFI